VLFLPRPACARACAWKGDTPADTTGPRPSDVHTTGRDGSCWFRHVSPACALQRTVRADRRPRGQGETQKRRLQQPFCFSGWTGPAAGCSQDAEAPFGETMGLEWPVYAREPVCSTPGVDSSMWRIDRAESVSLRPWSSKRIWLISALDFRRPRNLPPDALGPNPDWSM
jgi:hypothetical protein